MSEQSDNFENPFTNRPEIDHPFFPPRGCSTTDVRSLGDRLNGVKNHLRGFEDYLAPYEPREKLALSLIRSVVTAALQGRPLHGNEADAKLKADLSKIDSETNLGLNVLLSQGIMDIQEGKLVIIPSHRLGLHYKAKASAFAEGGDFKFDVNVPSGKIVKKFSGRIIGVAINTDHQSCQPLKEGQTRDLSYKTTMEILNAVVLAEKKLIQHGGKPPDNCLTAADLKAGFDWLMSGKPRKI